MVIRNLIAFFALSIFLTACQKNNPEGIITTPLADFHEIEINSNFDVYLVEDSVFFVEIHGHEKTIQKVTCTVESEVLTIDNLQKQKFTHPKSNKVTLYIHAKQLTKVSANETCQLKTVNAIHTTSFTYTAKSKANFADLEVNCTDFAYWNNFPCGGKITLRGTTNLLKIWNTAIMSIDAKGLTSSYAYIENSAKGLCELNVTNKLEYKLLGDGNIDVYGAPSEINELAKTGKGTLILH
ncbi:MAG: DUF2807 domain-containing protein [Crocinitomicaceae bacterium]